MLERGIYFDAAWQIQFTTLKTLGVDIQLSRVAGWDQGGNCMAYASQDYHTVF